MASFTAYFPRSFGDAVVAATEACWNPDDPSTSPISAIEVKVASPLPTQALEGLRRFFLQSLISDREPRRAARSLVQLAFETDLRVLLSNVDVPGDVLEAKLCTRTRYLTIDLAMRKQAFLYQPAVVDAVSHAVITRAYADSFLTRFVGTSPRARAGASAALLLLCADKLVA